MQDTLLIIAGALGIAVAIVHGALLQKMFVRPLLATADVSDQVRTMFPMLMHFSTAAWAIGGAALVAAPVLFSGSVAWTVAVIVGGMYGFAALGNFMMTKGKHFGWIPLALSAGLVAFALT